MITLIIVILVIFKLTKLAFIFFLVSFGVFICWVISNNTGNGSSTVAGHNQSNASSENSKSHTLETSTNKTLQGEIISRKESDGEPPLSSTGIIEKPIAMRNRDNIVLHSLKSDTDLDRILDTTDYVVLDTETTGLDSGKDKIVQIAIVSVRNGEVVDTFSSFVDPHCHMPESASRVNHITDEDLIGAPSMEDISDKVLELIGNFPVIAHNAIFDLNFLKQWYKDSEETIYITYIDTLALSKEAFTGTGGHSLPRLIEVLGIESGESHRADADALATQKLFELCKEKIAVKSSYEKDVSVKHTGIKPTVEHIDHNHPLYGKSMVFTGQLSIPRADAMQMAVNCGAVLRGRVTSRTDYLIVGKQHEEFVGSGGISGKQRQAMTVLADGTGHVKCISESEFFELLNYCKD